MWVILQNNADWDCFKTPILQVFKKQTSVSHSSTESEIISLDAGLRMDGTPALDLWDQSLETRLRTMIKR